MNRINLLKKVLQENNIESFLVFAQSNVTYLTGFNGHASSLLITPKNNYFITDYRYREQAESQVDDCIIVCRNRAKTTMGQQVAKTLKQDDVQKLHFEANHISVGLWQDIEKELAGVSVFESRRLVEDLRYVKEPREVDAIRNAAHIADEALERMLGVVEEGVTEKRLAAELEYQMNLLGSELPAFETILLFGERSALPHGIPGERKLAKGDLILIDFGAMVDSYRSDMTRTFVFGKPSDQQKEIYSLVSKAQQSALDALEVGVTGKYLAGISDSILKESDYSEYMGSGLGHGVGLDLHEFPFMGKDCDLEIKSGCVVTIEPGIYIPGWGGVRIEDDVAVTEAGIEILNQTPKTLIEL